MITSAGPMTSKIILLSILFSRVTATFAATNIEVVCVDSYKASTSREAHFNWLVESENGSEARMGQYACGSWWVAPAADDTGGVRLLSLSGNSENSGPDADLLSLDANPSPSSHGLLDGSKNYGSYNSNEDELRNLPKVFDPSTGSAISLVAAMQRPEGLTIPSSEGGGVVSSAGTKSIKGEAVDAYCVLTILDVPPANEGTNSIRPNIIGDKKEFLTWADFDLSKIPTHDFIPRSTIESFETQRLRWNHSTEVFSMRTWNGTSFASYSEGGRAFRPHILHHNYAGGRAASINNSIISMLGGNNTIEEKKPLLASLVAHGLDIWHFRYGRADFPGAWSSGAGQWGGQFMPAVFATALLLDNSKSNKLRETAALNIGADRDQRGPQEMRQILRGNTGVLLWGDGHNPTQAPTTKIPDATRRYWNDLKWGSCYRGATRPCNYNVGKKTTADPHGYIDGPPAKPGTNYFGIGTGNQRGFAAIMVLFPEARSIVNSDDVIEYTDRVHRNGLWTYPDPVASVSLIDQEGCNIWSSPGDGIGCSEYRNTWGPTLEDARFAHEDGLGRFFELHGTRIDMAYTSPLAESNWDSIMELYDGPRFEDNFVDLGKAVKPDIIVVPSQSTFTVHMRSGTTGAEIKYTIDGSDPSNISATYTGPFTTNNPSNVRAISVRNDLIQSDIQIYGNKQGALPNTPSELNVAPRD